MATGRDPPAGPVFDTAPAPPQRLDHRSTGFAGALTHAGALRRALLDPRIAREAQPAHWLSEDDPNRPRTLRICGSSLLIPEPFDVHPIAASCVAALDRAEQRFRTGRKDKHVGGELGSIVIRKKQFRPRKLAAAALKRAAHVEDGLQSVTPNGKRPLANGDASGSNKKVRLMANGTAPERDLVRLPRRRPVDYTAAYKNMVKTELIKAARLRSQQGIAQARLMKGVASACARDCRKTLLKSVRMSDDSYRRGRRMMRDVLQYWKREDKDRQEERKKLMARADELRRVEEEEREAQRQKNKLKFLLGQSEAFSSFLKAKATATDAAAAGAPPSSKKKLKSQDKGSKALDGITGDEDDADLKQKAEEHAAGLVAEHRQRLAQFDTDTDKRKRAANEMADRASANRNAMSRAVSNMDGLKEEELDALREAEANEVAAEEKQKQMAAARSAAGKPSEGGAMDGKPEVVAVKQPSILNCKMKDYQLRGLSWLVSLYDQGINGILADEMGLGKTLQTISFLAYLAEEEDNWGPFLVVSPKATLHNWQQEITKFCPDLKVLPYWGTKADRAELRAYWSPKRMYRRDSEFQVCVTSYETMTTDEKHFHRVKWQYLVLDEAQAIKNSSSSRWKSLLQFPCRNRLLLTGTPLQNKLSELWSLLHFIMPTIFDNHAEFADWFSKDIEGHAQNNKILDFATLKRLRTLLDPFMLRRVKRDVESEMPPKTEKLIRCQLVARQRQLYSSIRSNIPVNDIIRALSGGDGGNANGGGRGGNKGFHLDPGSSSQLMNIIMQMRKVCNHPETFERRIPQSSFQFQAAGPPSHVPLPPAILSGGGPVPPLDVTILTRPCIELCMPRALLDVEWSLASRVHMLCIRYGLWKPERWKRLCVGNNQALSVSAVYMSGGVSAGEVCSIFSGEVSLFWNWRDRARLVDRQLEHYGELYGYPQGAVSGEDRQHVAKTSATGEGNGQWISPHLSLLIPRAKALRRGRKVIIPGQESPADIIVRDTRLLQSTRVFIEAASSPPPRLYMAGDPREGSKLLAPDAKLVYPDIPRQGSMRDAREVYQGWRGLFGNYGEHVGTHQIVMPEAGRMVADSGKMMVLDPLLRRLKTEGHKCLIYSQFTKVLDILEDYCGMTGYKFVRIDGQSALADRRDIVAEWQSNEELFVFLLSTRAGGVGLNLTAADTVIFFDSDWNPTQDLQAMDRAHRLGQERPVTVYRLTSRGTIEERMLTRAQQKSRINDLVIKGGGIQNDCEEPKEAEIDDIAALLIGEDADESKLNLELAQSLARRAADQVGKADNRRERLGLSPYLEKVAAKQTAICDELCGV